MKPIGIFIWMFVMVVAVLSFADEVFLKYTDPPYLYDDTETVFFNETRLNLTIDSRLPSTSDIWVNESGDVMTGKLDIQSGTGGVGLEINMGMLYGNTIRYFGDENHSLLNAWWENGTRDLFYFYEETGGGDYCIAWSDFGEFHNMYTCIGDTQEDTYFDLTGHDLQNVAHGEFQNIHVSNDANVTNELRAGFYINDTLGFQLIENGSDLFIDANVGGSNKFGLKTDGAFFELTANPGGSNDYLLATITETQGSTTEINFYEGGVGHNRFYDSGSARFGGTAGSDCDALTEAVDCDTADTGADVVVQDMIWTGNGIWISDNVSMLYNGTEQRLTIRVS